MFKIIVSIFFVLFLLKGNAKKLSGEELEDAIKILNKALNMLNDQGGDVYKLQSIAGAYKSISNEISEQNSSYLQCQKSDHYTCML
ncbi:hypothetical protein CVS40_5418 [Lucilia cuprina]|nr:hypothetical protein CVS40_5418 [Lucilia cuprina]